MGPPVRGGWDRASYQPRGDSNPESETRNKSKTPQYRGEGRGTKMDPKVQKVLQRGVVIPAMPLALTAAKKLDERRQRALCRYYFAAGAGGLAVGVHTTQFQIHDPKVGLYEPLLRLAAEEFSRHDELAKSKGGDRKRHSKSGVIRVAGLCRLPADA